MKKFIVIGNPIEHSLSPKLHNYWFNKYDLIDHTYEKRKIEEGDLKKIIEEIKNDYLSGINVTVPFKKMVIPFCDKIDPIAKLTQSVNTVSKKNGKIIGSNTDYQAFKESIKLIPSKNSVFILGSGGVTSSILGAMRDTHQVFISNRTKRKAEELKDSFKGTINQIEIIDWGKKPSKKCDVVINTTSIGLKKDDKIDIDFDDYKGKKISFIDLIYNHKTSFLKEAEKRENHIIDGKSMFLGQAKHAFQIWTNILPKIDQDTIKLITND